MAAHMQLSLPHNQLTLHSPTEQSRQEILHDLTRLDRPRTVRPTTELIFHGLQMVISLYALLTTLRTIQFQSSQSYFSGTAWFLLLACYASLHLAVSYLILAWWSRQPNFQDEVTATLHEQDLARQQAESSSSSANQLSPPPPPPPIPRSKVIRYSAFLLSPRSRVWILISLVGFTLLASILQAYKIRRGTDCALYADALRQFCLTTKRAVGSSFVESFFWMGWLFFWFLVSYYKGTGDGGLKQESITTARTWMRENATRILTHAKEFVNNQRNRVGPQPTHVDARMSGHIPHDSLPMQEKSMDGSHERSLQNISIHQFEQQQPQQQQQQQEPKGVNHIAEIKNALFLTASQAFLRAFPVHQEQEQQHPLDIGPHVPPKDSKGKGVIPGGMGSTGQLPTLPSETPNVITTQVPVAFDSANAGGSTGLVIQPAGESPGDDAPWSPVADHSTRLRDYAKIFPRPRSSSTLNLARRKSSRESILTPCSISTQATRLSMSRGELGYMGNRTLKDLRSSNSITSSPRSYSMGNIASAFPKSSVEDGKLLDKQLRAIRRRSCSNNSLSEPRSTEEMFKPEDTSSFLRNLPESRRTSFSSPALAVIRRSSLGIKNVIATLVSAGDPMSDSGSSSFSSYTSDGSTSSLGDNPIAATGDLSRYQIQSQEAFVPLGLSLGTDILKDISLFTPEDGESQQRRQSESFVLSPDTNGALRPQTKSISLSKSSTSMATLGQSLNWPLQTNPSSTTPSAKTTGAETVVATGNEVVVASFPILTKASQVQLSKYRSGELPYPPPPPISPTGTSFSRMTLSKDMATKVGNSSDIIERSARMEDDDNVGFKKQLNKNTKGRVRSFEVLASRVST